MMAGSHPSTSGFGTFISSVCFGPVKTKSKINLFVLGVLPLVGVTQLKGSETLAETSRPSLLANYQKCYHNLLIVACPVEANGTSQGSTYLEDFMLLAITS